MRKQRRASGGTAAAPKPLAPKQSAEGEMFATITVRELPPRLSCSSRVSTESR